MFSSPHGSQCDSEYKYIPGYIIEDESNDTSHEIRTLEAVDSEILGIMMHAFMLMNATRDI
jgi:hypothetical protein